MLEKMFGCVLITKLQSILLMEVDFNATNKIIYGQQMLHQARKYKLIPEEIYSNWNRLADDRTLAKVLFYDIVCQTWLPAGISTADADNCYNQIGHPIASLVFQALGSLKEVVISFLFTIQDMKIFLRTDFKDSKVYAGLTDGKKTQGLCQGNGAAPAGWTITSIPMLQVHKRKGHGVHLLCPITKTLIHLAGTFFVNDTNLEHLDTTKVETIMEVHEAMQCSIHNWGHILIATGGALKPVKWFYHLILFSWNLDGTWWNDANDQHLDLSIMVPLEDSTLAAIEHLPHTTPTKTLGQMTCPMGSSDGAIVQMQEKAKGWITKAKESKLHKGNLNFFLDKQFWLRVSFNISSVCATFEELEECLMRIYYDMLPLCGI